jgi:hypothetical protein
VNEDTKTYQTDKKTDVNEDTLVPLILLCCAGWWDDQLSYSNDVEIQIITDHTKNSGRRASNEDFKKKIKLISVGGASKITSGEAWT